MTLRSAWRERSLQSMATTTVTNQSEGFTTPLDEADRFSTNRELHFVPEWEQSGRLPASPNVPDAAPGNHKPFKI